MQDVRWVAAAKRLGEISAGALVLSCGEPNLEDECGPDLDGDGVQQCEDDDDDGDGILDADELERGTDPAKPTILVETDYMDDGASAFFPTEEMLELAESSFAAAGIEAVFEVGDPVSVVSPLTAAEDMESVLSGSKNEGASYLHVVIADVGDAGKHGTAHYAVPNTGGFGDQPMPDFAGSFVFAGQIAQDYAQYQSEFEAWDISLDHLVARSLVHEIGHLIGCTHDTSDPANVMAQNSVVGAVTSENEDRWKDAVLGGSREGYPIFLDASLDQVDLSFKASAEVGTSPSERAFDFGPAGSAISPGTILITPADVFEPGPAYGWVETAPTEASADGSDPSDDRLADYVAGDPNTEADAVFRIEALGQAKVRVYAHVGSSGGPERTVRCELRHPEMGTGWFEVSLTASTLSHGYWFDPVWPVSPGREGAFPRSTVEFRCLDDATHDDAPIEYLRVEKPDI